MGFGGSLGKVFSGALNFLGGPLGAIFNTAPWAAQKALDSTLGIASGMRRSRRSNQAAEGILTADQIAQRKAIEGMALDAYERYRTGALRKGTRRDIERREKIRKAQAAEALGKAGIGDSSTAVDTKRGIESMTVQELDAARDREFNKAMTALGMSNEAAQIISGMHVADRKATTDAFVSTMTALGSLTSMLGKG